MISIFIYCDRMEIDIKTNEAMAQQTINLGSAYGDPTADKTRDAFDKVNDNFTELYASKLLKMNIETVLTVDDCKPTIPVSFLEIQNSVPGSYNFTNIIPLSGSYADGDVVFLTYTDGDAVVIKNNATIKTRTGSDVTMTLDLVYGFILFDSIWRQIF